MQFASALSRYASPEQSVSELMSQVQDALPGSPDLAILFVSGYDPVMVEEIAGGIRERLQPATLIGCTAEGVIGTGEEVEREPGVSLMAGVLPGVEVTPFHIGREEWGEMVQSPTALKARTQSPQTPKGYIVLGEPFTTPIQEFLAALSTLTPDAVITGGMASGSYQPKGNRLIFNDQVFDEGAVGLSLSGPVRVLPIVSQGCRAIGPRYLITDADANMIRTLSDRPALEAFQQMAIELPPGDKFLLQQGIFAGLTIEELADPFGRGEALMRGVIGADKETGAIAIGDLVQTGQTMQFYVRDAESADMELKRLLKEKGTDAAPAAGLLFSCNGRGTRMFPDPHHDAQAANEAYPQLPIAGFFAAGEIGSISGKPFLHGHTASIALLLPEESQ